MQNITRSLKMGASGKGESVLRLVHPGGFMEIHRRPVKASEVIEKNPRHCVTRPDVFKFPWIVVSPDSILEPGNVFYIVPNHTIYSLLQAHGSSAKLKPRRGLGEDLSREALNLNPPLNPPAESALDDCHFYHVYYASMPFVVWEWDPMKFRSRRLQSLVTVSKCACSCSYKRKIFTSPKRKRKRKSCTLPMPCTCRSMSFWPPL
ncbi:hypothetical protein CKAN_00268000 [Cinnamomum micranthum f. kanehirae]|uniref:Uncharacterized protein n=1 Tax=Cinnamomum micranthum f. kanehirae TaxID=337451 RepID=A0A443N765_9MAGN|nr:hypothetical protein CKAN_00268000 [Cinnamomum micranthum f. kanehirae]